MAKLKMKCNNIFVFFLNQFLSFCRPNAIFPRIYILIIPNSFDMTSTSTSTFENVNLVFAYYLIFDIIRQHMTTTIFAKEGHEITKIILPKEEENHQPTSKKNNHNIHKKKKKKNRTNFHGSKNKNKS